VSATRFFRRLCTWAGNERNDELLPIKPWMYTTRSFRFRSLPAFSFVDDTNDWLDDVRGSREVHCGPERLPRTLPVPVPGLSPYDSR
jgi:hypothetical protein